MFKLKPISRDAIPRAIQKAERYRLLNQSWAAESICLDILEVDPENQQVLVMLVLALTDLHSGVAVSGVMRAKDWYEKAEAIRPAGNDDAILRWNTCARVLSGNSHLAPVSDDGYEPVLED